MNIEKIIKILDQIQEGLEEIKKEIVFPAVSEKGAKNEKFKYHDKTTSPAKIDFGMGERAFMKKYAKGLSGPKKFVLLLAYLTKGTANVVSEVSIEEIKKKWGKMISLCGGKFNTYYSTTARDNNWADSKKHGIWHLTNNWMEIFS